MHVAPAHILTDLLFSIFTPYQQYFSHSNAARILDIVLIHRFNSFNSDLLSNHSLDSCAYLDQYRTL